jgi:hypothetical protein
MSSNKVDFWTALDVDLTSVCSADGATYEATYTITSTLTPELASSLPFYQTGGWWGTEKYRTETYVLGPVGSSFLDSNVEVASLSNSVISVAPDLGRPVVRLAVEMPPGGTSTVTVRFTAAEPGGPLELKTTPLVIPTTSTITDGCS